MFLPMYFSIDLSCDENKYITRYIGTSWSFSLGQSAAKAIERIFGNIIPRTLLIRRRTPDELLQLVLTKIKQHDQSIDTKDENLKYRLKYRIGRGETGMVKINEHLSVELILKW